MISWSVTASFLRVLNSLEIRIPLNSIANGFKIIKTDIIDDVLTRPKVEVSHHHMYI
jgi:hypothetical protein